MDKAPSKQLLNRVTQQLTQASSNSSQIPAGQNKPPADEFINSINQIFAMFRFNYHNQFTKAFPDFDTMNTAKQLWAKVLAEYSGEVIMRAAEKAVKESTFLPNVHEVLVRCDVAEVLGLPNAYAAYIEACRAPTPKQDFAWSHAAVYYAGRASDWFLLANETEAKAFPVFQRNYDILLQRLQNGEELELEVAKAIPEKIERPLDNQEQKQRLASLISTL